MKAIYIGKTRNQFHRFKIYEFERTDNLSYSKTIRIKFFGDYYFSSAITKSFYEKCFIEINDNYFKNTKS